MLTLQKFTEVFKGAYVCGMIEGGVQVEGFKVNNMNVFNERVSRLQAKMLNVHFTPNGIIEPQNHNQKANIEKINAWYLDIDVEETKTIKSPKDLDLREKRKEEIFTTLFFDFLLEPSLVVEGRNGYHVYWFAKDATLENFDGIQKALCAKMACHGADVGASRSSSMLKVPFTTFWKKGERGIHKPLNIIGTLESYDEESMIRMCRGLRATVAPVLISSNPIPVTKKKKTVFSQQDIKGKLGRLSGHAAVNNEIISFKRTFQDESKEKYNVFFNGLPSPIWLDQATGSIYSSNDSDLRTISELLDWYIANSQSTEALKEEALKIIN